jgi:hypothetical protein
MVGDKVGSCCNELSRALTEPPMSLFRLEENGILYLSIGYVETESGLGWFDAAVIYYPFCGRKLQSPEEIRDKAGRTTV